MALDCEVECGNWKVLITIEDGPSNKIIDKYIEAMTQAVEKYVAGDHEDFVSEDGLDLSLAHYISCEGHICTTEHILINAGRHDVANIIKTLGDM